MLYVSAGAIYDDAYISSTCRGTRGVTPFNMIWKWPTAKRADGIESQENFESDPHCSRGGECHSRINAGLANITGFGPRGTVYQCLQERDSKRQLIPDTAK